MKVILLTAIESLREEKKKTKKKRKKKQKHKRREGNSRKTEISTGSKSIINTSLNVTSVEAAEAWPKHSDGKARLQWISGLKVLGESLHCTVHSALFVTLIYFVIQTFYATDHFQKSGFYL